MLKPTKPALDDAVTPLVGRSNKGQPLSYNRAPASDLAPWLGRIYVTPVNLPPDYCLSSGIFNDSSMVRIQLGGKWTAHTADGVHHLGRAALIFGPQSKVMPVTVEGSFMSIGYALTAGTGYALFGRSAHEMVNRLVPLEHFGMNSEETLAAFSHTEDPVAIADLLERRFRVLVERLGRPHPNPISAAFEALTYANPNASISDFAASMAISTRQLERIVRRDFGMPPKQVMRRARALDMASHLHGVADEAEAEELILRYFDQAQMTREFTELFGVPPRRFVKTPNPLLTLALESRQAKRLEALDRVAPGGHRPWQ
jgi:AraC-like DNA-binding protein